MAPPTPWKIIHMTVVADCDKSGRVGPPSAFGTGNSVPDISVEVKVIPGIEYISTFAAGADMHVRE